MCDWWPYSPGWLVVVFLLLAAIPWIAIYYSGRVKRAERALEMLYLDHEEYVILNHLGGYDNHCMRLAREVLGIPGIRGRR